MDQIPTGIQRSILLSGESYSASKAYWIEQLPDEFITDAFIYYHSDNEAGSQHVCTLVFPEALNERIFTISKQSELGMYIYLLTALQLLINKYAYGERISILSPLYKPAISSATLNHFVVVTNEVSADSTIKELLLNVRAAVSNAYTHQDYPLEDLLQDRYPEGRASRQLPNIVCSMAGIHAAIATPLKENIHFQFGIDSGSIQLSIHYDTSVCPQHWIQQVGRHFQAILAAMINDHQQLVAAISCLTPAEEYELIYTRNDTARAYPQQETVVSLVSQVTLNDPDKIALVCEDRELTYRQLDEIAGQLAAFLAIRWQVQRQDNILILLERSEWWAIAILATWKLGAVYVPADVNYPAARLSWLREHSSCRLVLDEDVLIQFRAHPPVAPHFTDIPAPQDVAYIIYTSGTTGVPKGAVIEHAGMLNHLYAKVNDLVLNADTRVAQNASHCFDISIWQLFAALISGGTTYILPAAWTLDPDQLLNAVLKYQVDILEVVPSQLSLLLDVMPPEDSRLQCLRHLLVTGEAVKSALLERCFSRWPSLSIVNAYGPTEAADDITHLFANPADVYDPVPVGKPVQNMHIYILDRRQQLCPPGVKGEICVSGVGVGRGYFKDEERTLLAFMTDPFRPEQSLRMYRTGDLGRLLEDGNIAFLGRMDQQVKIRGYRIELEEVENVLMQVSQATAVAALPVTAADESTLLCTFLAGVDKSMQQPAEIKRLMKQRLPEYMVPDQLIFLESLPLTNNGKTDRKALKALVPDNTVKSNTTKQLPVTVLQQQLLRIWQQVLSADIGITDNFFDAGGHSLNAARIAAFTRKELEKELRIADIFKHPTVETLSIFLEKQEHDPLQPLSVAPLRAFYELSPLQEEIWLARQMDEAGSSYNISRQVSLTGPLQPKLLEQAINKIIAQHESLRTIFVTLDNIVYQQILPADQVHLEMPVIALPADSVDDTTVRHRLHLLTNEAFTPEQWPLIKLSLLQLAPAHFLLVMNVHHIILDGWSVQLLIEQLYLEYNQLLSGKDMPRPLIAAQYKDFVYWQRQLETAPGAADTRRFWQRELSQLPAEMELPTDHPRPATRSFKGETIRFKLNEQQRTGLEAMAREQQASLFMVLLSALYVLLFRYTGSSHLVVGTPATGRNRLELESILGLIANVLPVQTTVSGALTFHRLLEQVRDKLLELYEYQHYPYQQWKESEEASKDNRPLFDVMMVLHNYIHLSSEQSMLNDVIVEDVDIPGTTSKFDLLFEIIDYNTYLAVDLEFDTALFEKETAIRFAGHFKEVIDDILANPGKEIQHISYLSAPEQTQIRRFGMPAVPVTDLPHIPAAFELATGRYASQTAVCCNKQVLSYAQLDAAINSIADYLRQQGVAAGNKVVVIRKRSVWQAAAMMAIFHIGACYVPLDPDWPEERLAYAVRTAAPVVVFADKHTTMLAAQWGYPIEDPESLISDDMNERSSVAPVIVPPDTDAYIIFTSGSTGQPKGVVQSYRTLNNLMQWQLTSSGIDGGLSLLQFTSFGFDVSLQDTLFTLLTGGILHIADESLRTDIEQLGAYVCQEQIAILSMPYSILIRLIGWINTFGQTTQQLQHIITAGEQPFLDETLRKFLGYAPIPLHNHYGPSETHVCTSYTLHYTDQAVRVLPAGAPVPGFHIRILDSGREDTAVGIPGEIYISGAGVFTGYLGDDALTNARFVEMEGKQWYRSGDLGKWLPDGNIQFLARVDQQLKINGYRVEAAEIENILLELEGIQQAVVIKKQFADKDSLVCFFQSASLQEEVSLRRLLNTRLPYYMIPEVFVQLDNLPVNNNGKADRKHLSEMIIKDPQQQKVMPGNDTEMGLQLIWQELLKKSDIGIHDNFFLLGGQSLKATRLMMQIAQQFKISTSIKTIFTYPTIAELADYIREQQRNQQDTALADDHANTILI